LGPHESEDNPELYSSPVGEDSRGSGEVGVRMRENVLDKYMGIN